MELGTFGAVFAFALELERRAQAFYEAVPADLARSYRPLAAGSRKRLGRLERARQEGISEMILEAITGLHSEDYEVPSEGAAGEEAWRGAAVALEATAARFYRAAAAKMPIAEAARLFQRMAQENDQRLEQAQALNNPSPPMRV